MAFSCNVNALVGAVKAAFIGDKEMTNDVCKQIMAAIEQAGGRPTYHVTIEEQNAHQSRLVITFDGNCNLLTFVQAIDANCAEECAAMNKRFIDTSPEDYINPLIAALMYFFQLRKNDFAGDGLTGQACREAVSIFTQINKYCEEHPDYFQNEADLVRQFSEQYEVNAAHIDAITMPTDIVFSDPDVWSYQASKSGEKFRRQYNTSRGGEGDACVDVTITPQFEKAQKAIEQALKLHEDDMVLQSLSQFDRRVLTGAMSFWSCGQKTFSITALCAAIGYGNRPNSRMVTDVVESIIKMRHTDVTYDRKAEIANGYKAGGTSFFNGSILPNSIAGRRIEGSIVEMAITLLGESPMLTFAKDRKQVTQFDPVMLQAPASKSSMELAIEHYLTLRIARYVNGRNKAQKSIDKIQRTKPQNRTDKDKDRLVQMQKDVKSPLAILVPTLSDAIGAKDRWQRGRALKQVKVNLEHFKANGKIEKYTITPTRIEIWTSGAGVSNDDLV